MLFYHHHHNSSPALWWYMHDAGSKLSQDEARIRAEITDWSNNCPIVRHLYVGDTIGAASHICTVLHLYLSECAFVFVRVCICICPSVQLYLFECAIVFGQCERHCDTMKEKGQDESFNTALPFDLYLTIALKGDDFDDGCLFVRDEPHCCAVLYLYKYAIV